MYIKIKRSVYNLIRDDDQNNLASSIFDGFIIALIILSVISIILDTFSAIPPIVRRISGYIEIGSVVIFSIEYILRLWTANYIYPEKKPWKARLKYVTSFIAIIDLLAILPFYLPFVFPVDLRVLRSVRLLRLLRLLKINRYTSALSTVSKVLKKKAPQLISSMLVVLILMIIASVLMYNIESEAQPEVFENVFSSFWWAIATFTTVGYGDIYPITGLGKLLSAVIALLGIGLVAVPTGIISAGFTENIEEDKNKEENEKHYCPYCGNKLD